MDERMPFERHLAAGIVQLAGPRRSVPAPAIARRAMALNGGGIGARSRISMLRMPAPASARLLAVAAALTLVVVVGFGLFLARPALIVPGASPSPRATPSAIQSATPTPDATAQVVQPTPSATRGASTAAWVVFVLHHFIGTTPANLWAMRVDGTDLRQLVSRDGFIQLAWSTDGATLLMNSTTIWLAEVDHAIGTFVDTGFSTGADDACRQRTGRDEPCLDSEFVFSPDGNQVAFVRSCSHARALPTCYLLVTMNLRTGTVTELESTVSNKSHAITGPSWSPDGSRIAFARVRSSVGLPEGYPSVDLYTVKPDGSDEQQIAIGGLSAVSPAWSPDGSSIAFSSFTSAIGFPVVEDLYRAAVDGSDLQQLTHDGRSRWPAWTLGGAIRFNDGHNAQTYFLIDGEGGNRRLLVDLSSIGTQTESYLPSSVTFQPAR